MLRGKLAGDRFALVLCSPLRRARETCQLAGFADVAEIDDDLIEWDYGEYEGLTTPQIRESNPPGGCGATAARAARSPDEIGARRGPRAGALRRGRRATGWPSPTGTSLRVLTARWLEMEVAAGARFKLEAGSLGVLGHERETHRDRALERMTDVIGDFGGAPLTRGPARAYAPCHEFDSHTRSRAGDRSP